jgi:hypothetical protein
VIRLTKSQPVALLGEAPPRVLVEPKGSRANSWEDVADLSARAGIQLDGWQELILEAAMGERADNTWAAKRVGVSVGRQNGKSQLLVARALAGVLLFGEKKIVISAHQQDTAREAFSKLVEILEADGNGWLMDRVRPNGVMNAINREAVKFKNGATVQFKARTNAGGRGFSSDCLLLDEAQRLKRSAWVSINSTMSAMPNPQVWLLGTPPTPEDDGDVFESIRTAAVEGSSGSSAWAEWGGNVNSDEYEEARKDLLAKRWSPAVEYICWSANPAWNARLNKEVVQGELESYETVEFAQDRLGIWRSELGGGGTRAISEDTWNGLIGTAPDDGMPSYGVAFSPTGKRMSVGGAVKSSDSAVHVELVTDPYEGDLEAGLSPIADWFAAKTPNGQIRWKRAGVIVLSGSAGAGVLRQMLLDRGVSPRRILVASTPQYLQACEMFRNAAEERLMTRSAHGQDALTASIAVCDRDKRGGWLATVPEMDETPTEAVSLALWGARTAKRQPRDGERKVVIL